MTRARIAWLFVVCMASPCAPVAEAQTPIPVMLLDGESGGPYHDW